MTAWRKSISEKKDWCTPEKIASVVREFFQTVELDPCSNKCSIVNARTEYIFPRHDGLKESWDFRTIYVNPPYGSSPETWTSIKHWIKRCADAFFEFDSEVIALIPVAVNTTHWKEYIFWKATSVCFLADSRLKFINGANDKWAPMACALVYWWKKELDFYDSFSGLGAVIHLSNLKERGWASPDSRNKIKAPK